MTPRFVLIRRLLAGFALAAATASATLAATPCTTKPGTDGTLIEARVLTPGGMLAKGLVLIGADGQIACVGSSCAARAPRAAVIRCPRAVLSPGFINDHEHLDFAGDAPKPDDGVRYGQRQDWRKGLRGKPMQTYVPSRDRDLLSWGELRHLLSGTTSMIGEAYAPGLVRNLDFQAGLEGLDTPRASYAVFPLDDGAGTQRDGDCNYGPNPINEGQASALHALVAHVAEGRDAVARNEFYCISSMMFDTAPAPGGGGTSHDILYSNLAIVHGAALTPEMLAVVARRHVGIIWSPRSNLALYGKTLDVAAARKLGVTLALGTDWLPSGSMSMPREAACALDYSREHLGGLLTPHDLWTMMTINAAKVVHVDNVVGAIRPGLAADLILVDPKSADPYEAVVRAAPEDLLMVMRGGKLLAGAPAIAAAARARGCESVDINGVSHAVCISGEAGKTYAVLAQEMATQNIWPAFFKGAPPIEPTCETHD